MPGMSAEEVKATARRYMDELYNKGATAVVYEVLATDFVYRSALPPITPDREGIIQEMNMMRAAFPDLRGTVDDLLVEGDKGTMRWTMRGTHEGAFMGVPPTHKQVVWSGVAFWRSVDNKLVETWNYADDMSLFQQLGAMPQAALGQQPGAFQAQPPV